MLKVKMTPPVEQVKLSWRVAGEVLQSGIRRMIYQRRHAIVDTALKTVRGPLSKHATLQSLVSVILTTEQSDDTFFSN
jgi:hypothetical protein